MNKPQTLAFKENFCLEGENLPPEVLKKTMKDAMKRALMVINNRLISKHDGKKLKCPNKYLKQPGNFF